MEIECGMGHLECSPQDGDLQCIKSQSTGFPPHFCSCGIIERQGESLVRAYIASFTQSIQQNCGINNSSRKAENVVFSGDKKTQHLQSSARSSGAGANVRMALETRTSTGTLCSRAFYSNVDLLNLHGTAASRASDDCIP